MICLIFRSFKFKKPHVTGVFHIGQHRLWTDGQKLPRRWGTEWGNRDCQGHHRQYFGKKIMFFFSPVLLWPLHMTCHHRPSGLLIFVFSCLFLLHTHPPKLCTVTFLPHWLDWAESRGRESVAFKLLLSLPHSHLVKWSRAGCHP